MIINVHRRTCKAAVSLPPKIIENLSLDIILVVRQDFDIENDSTLFPIHGHSFWI